MKTILLFFGFFALPLLAELSNSAYLEMKKKAPEQVEIQVTKAKRGLWISPGEVVTATVTKVSRSSSKLKVGDVITIRYRHVSMRGRVGPAPIPRLDKKKKYTAWLRKNAKGHFEPAARGQSFSKVS